MIVVIYSRSEIPTIRRDGHEENLPTFQEEEEENPRIPGQEQEQIREEDPEAQEEEGKVETLRLRRCERLRLKRDFDRVFELGRSVAEDFMRVVYVENQRGMRRIGIVVRKRIGKAHVRNRLKRLVREAYRKNKGIFPEGVDMVFIYRTAVADRAKLLKLHDVERVLRRISERMR